MSLSSLIDRFKHGLSNPADTRPQHDPIRLATAAVLLEIAQADGQFAAPEGADIAAYLQKAFDLDADSARELMEAAAEIRNQTIDYFAMTNYLRRTTSLEERIEIVKTMWRIVYADGRLSDYENYLVRKLADLLGLEHRVMIAAKVVVLEERGEAV